jgi:hypothetical protein
MTDDNKRDDQKRNDDKDRKRLSDEEMEDVAAGSERPDRLQWSFTFSPNYVKIS